MSTAVSSTVGVAQETVDAVVVGAGFAGMYMLHRLREQGLVVRVFETGDDVGGTWYWNRYPGARCDVESLEYSYQFDDALQQSWQWKERYSPQPDILDYCRHVAERYDLRRDISFEHRVTAAHFDEDARCWRVAAEGPDGEVRVTARFVIMATGCLSVPMDPEIAGKEHFRGDTYHTGRWPKQGVDFSGQRVAVVGTGSSAIQAIPHIAEQAAQLTVYQRTPNHSVPAHNGPLDGTLEARIKAAYEEFRARNAQEIVGFGARHPMNPGSALEATEAEFDLLMEHFWGLGGLLFGRAAADMGTNKEANDRVSDFVRRKIAEAVDDPAVAEKLMPWTPFGCKRPCADTGYFETYNRSNVELVDASEAPIEAITEDGIRTTQDERAFDAIVFATGFDAMTGALARIDVRGRDGVSLQERWSAGPRTYLGLQSVGFPNLFTVTGPGSPSVLTNMLPSIEQHVRFIGDAIADLDRRGLATIEPTQDAQDQWVDHVNEVADTTLYPSCNSWYLGANVPGKPRVFMPYLGFPAYCEICEEVVAEGYRGFARSNA